MVLPAVFSIDSELGTEKVADGSWKHSYFTQDQKNKTKKKPTRGRKKSVVTVNEIPVIRKTHAIKPVRAWYSSALRLPPVLHRRGTELKHSLPPFCPTDDGPVPMGRIFHVRLWATTSPAQFLHLVSPSACGIAFVPVRVLSSLGMLLINLSGRGAQAATPF